MSAKSFSKPRLSKGILEMKFMQRTKDKVDKEIEAAEGRAMYSNEITDKMLNGNSNFIIEPSFVHCENLIDGRLSFRGMNPEIERLLELEREEKAAAKKQEQSTDVSNEDMMKFYQNKTAGAGHTIEKKFSKFKKVNNNQNKNHNNNKRHIVEGAGAAGSAGKNKKSKFMKPKDSDDDEQND
ncbi:M-phase phosphoprotein 6 [Calliphora vicina]|uniref:M-phase phosphoprotein 6 n=1 Tax=Calliphora vicina TaxID=7373 RepID=UPI00325BDD8D